MLAGRGRCEDQTHTHTTHLLGRRVRYGIAQIIKFILGLFPRFLIQIDTRESVRDSDVVVKL